MKTSVGLRKWRREQKKEAIMKSSTFESIKESEIEKGLSEERATKAAGAAYWAAARKKYRERK